MEAFNYDNITHVIFLSLCHYQKFNCNFVVLMYHMLMSVIF